MPQVRKLTVEEATQTAQPKRGRGRPKGSTNRKVDAEGFEAEKLYTYRAKDGCEMKSAVKSKGMTLSCPHGKTMELVK